jgi:hypothetical protein
MGGHGRFDCRCFFEGFSVGFSRGYYSSYDGQTSVAEVEYLVRTRRDGIAEEQRTAGTVRITPRRGGSSRALSTAGLHVVRTIVADVDKEQKSRCHGMRHSQDSLHK